MNGREIAAVLVKWLGRSGMSEWELHRRTDLPRQVVSDALRSADDITVGQLVEVAQALGLEVSLQGAEVPRRFVGEVPSVVDLAVQRVAPGRIVRDAPVSWVLAMELDALTESGTAGNAVRPGLFRFLTCCRPLVSTVMVLAALKEQDFRKVATLLVGHGHAPGWFAEVKYLQAPRPLGGFGLVVQAELPPTQVVDELANFLYSSEKVQWVPIRPYESQAALEGGELDRALESLVRRTTLDVGR